MPTWHQGFVCAWSEVLSVVMNVGKIVYLYKFIFLYGKRDFENRMLRIVFDDTRKWQQTGGNCIVRSFVISCLH
jgi:hypothetical protein